MTEAEFWRLTVNLLLVVGVFAGSGFAYLWYQSRQFDRRYGRGPKR